MIQVLCDSCGKVVRGAARGATYITMLGYDLCLPCRDSFFRQAGKATMREERYKLKTYESICKQTLRRMCK
jgi:hypothetical protein